MDMGFENAGFPAVWTNEMDPIFAQLYAAGMTSWRKKKKGIDKPAQISAVGKLLDLGGEEVILHKAFPKGRPALFGLIGGPPCQDFSSAGLRAGFDGWRGDVTHQYCLHISYMQPAFFIMENVTGLLEKKHRTEFTELCRFLSKDYLVDYAKLNALDYGVPQSRERLFIIGLRRNLLIPARAAEAAQYLPGSGWVDWNQEKACIKAQRKYKWPKTEKLGAKPKQPTDKSQYALCLDKCLVSAAEEKTLANASERFNLLSEKHLTIAEGDVSRRSFKKLHRYRFSPTACYGNNEVHLHPYNGKRLSVREVLRIQGVDDEYELPATNGFLTKKFKMIGNGVPVPLAEGVARTVARLLETYCGIKTSKMCYDHSSE
ncbi:DNA (cytosine-5)-methyltransferase 1 [Hymenobacter psychrotolerans DSM 18569]|uniref:DNA (cytosine-5-)-methyltransferase n=2 Tax=Hymenobacter psychrotolerans TaxID=344998 RepID=A0A1M7EH44_9BACT|nr:DNA (cytosine-5)-methyltransferase 1 [Hymenobacter psychrotolerans DSM 18569]